MDALLAALEGTVLASALRGARWGYAAVSGVHILGVAILVGAVVPLNLRLLGLWREAPRDLVIRMLAPMAAAGLAIAITAGLLLFSIRAREYAGVGFLQAKLLLVALGTASALWAHAKHGAALEGASDARLRAHAVVSLACWLSALFLGRLIAFATD